MPCGNTGNVNKEWVGNRAISLWPAGLKLSPVSFDFSSAENYERINHNRAGQQNHAIPGYANTLIKAKGFISEISRHTGRLPCVISIE